jgi:hypothetical protein
VTNGLFSGSGSGTESRVLSATPRSTPDFSLSRRLSNSLLPLLVCAGWVFAGTAVAQDSFSQREQQPQQNPADPAKPAAPQPNSKKPSDPQNQGTGPTGKSKLEQETGTVNDRILAVMPNYTVENQNVLPALTPGQKFHFASATVFDCGAGLRTSVGKSRTGPVLWLS